MSGVFVTFEGPEGAGKSTQVKLLTGKLEKHDVKFTTTREPGGTELADTLRRVLAESRDASIDARTELLLLLAARSDHVEKLIRPALEANRMVVCDRYTDSTVCYQGAGRGINHDTIALLNDYATGGLVPDITFLIDVEPSVGLGRLAKSGRQLDRFEREAVDFHARVYQGYKELAQSAPERVVVVRGDREPEKVSEDVFQALWSAFPTMSKDR